MKKRRPIKKQSVWLLNNYIYESWRKTACSFKDNIVSLFETNTPKDYGKKTCTRQETNEVNQKHRIHLKKKQHIIKSIKNLFRTKKETEAFKDRIIRDIRRWLRKKIIINQQE